LQTVEPLQPGRGGRETSSTPGSVSWEVVQKTLPHLPPLIQVFVVTLFHSGARCGELAKLATGMIDRTGEVWVVDLDQHKNSRKKKSQDFYRSQRTDRTAPVAAERTTRRTHLLPVAG